MDDITLLVIYKSLRLPLLVIALLVIFFHTYRKKNRESMETPKYRMLEED
ncbi:MAG: CcoQ/FixQ family Cbb3-type cytochrome c oxidase assembly chaperone [Leptospiraceae bacterium]|nr:CcoQ/FixQ family Cbb3-type cytochrome c oxidase assembly chaperone [Leptospiraceae bacterium]